MNNMTKAHIAVASGSGGFVLALVTITSRILANYGIAMDSDMAAALVTLFTPVVHILAVRFGLEPSQPPAAPPA
jgi:hypothetical protein